MKRILFALMILALCFCHPAIAKDAFHGTLIASTLLDDDPVVATSDTFDAAQYDKIAFYVSTDETDSGNDTSVAVTLQISYDDSTWFAASFYDYAGGATLQTSQTMGTGVSTDENYYCWFNRDINVRYFRMVITQTGGASGGDDETTVVAYFTAQK